ncbi:RNA-binding domain-containing protein [Macellibacteroides fermentans]|uniref:RNA-binding domain-containing protein n=1 Tax=Macellibacteroides fermentans TaxID=879969 RepID=UPI00406D4F23
MNTIELLDIISSGETSRVQFKQEMDDDKFAAEMIAMSNSKGGVILLGIEDKTGKIVGLSYEQLQSSSNNYNSRLANVANDKVKPQIFIETEVLTVNTDDGEKKVLVVTIPEGVSKPYKDKNGAIWIKQGADKRKLTDNNEQIRLFQQSGSLYVDEMIIPNTSVADVDKSKVEKYIKVIQKSDSEEKVEIDEKLLTNLNIIKDNKLTLGGLEFFANNPQKYRPAFCIKAISFLGNSIGGSSYRDSKDIEGTIPEMFDQAMAFLASNLRSVQAEQNFNSVGILEISKIALEELVQNALTHRDYSKNSPIRIMIFDNRVEIVSPGSLPNSLTIENIKMGNAVVRNNLMVSYCSKLMNYRGFGSGITRALDNQPNIELINDVDGEQFIVKIPRVQQN